VEKFRFDAVPLQTGFIVVQENFRHYGVDYYYDGKIRQMNFLG
jgi:hypothetical protein